MRGSVKNSVSFFETSEKWKNLTFFDTHAHLDDERILGDSAFDKLLENLEKNFYVVIPAVDLNTQNARHIVSSSQRIYYSAGIHPHEASKYVDTEFSSHILKELEDKKCVAVGEVGLDYYYDFSTPADQKEVFEEMVKIAHSTGYPLIIHLREEEAYEDAFKILSKYRKVQFVLHCFSSNADTALKFLENFDCFIGVGGVVTFKNARKLQEVVKEVSLDRILIETDSPYLSPHPYRGIVNTPLFIPLVVEKIAQIKRIPSREVAIKTLQNALEFFGIS